MSGSTNSDFSRALSELTIFALWREANLPGPAPTRDDVYKSPFREERTGSFSILGGGKGFRDHGSDLKGGVKDFAKLCWPNDTEDQLKDRLVDLAGTRTHKPAAAAAATPGAPAAVDPSVLKAAKTIERRRQERAAEERIYAEHEAQLRVQVDEKKTFVPYWPDCVKERYLEGVAMMVADGKIQERLAKDRGWPYFWVGELLAAELLSYPWERGCDAGDRYQRRQKAFRVDYPIILQEEAGARVTLQPVGYHQRFFMPEKDGRAQKKGWLYVPSYPKEKARSHYETALIEAGRARELAYDPEKGVRDQFIPPLPFVIGDLVNTRTIVLLEGQWDAITFFGACGWFHDTSAPQGVAVFGIRGAQGMDPFLGYWGRWLRANRPLAWVIADNDNAGRSWREAPAAADGQLQPPSLAQRLAAAGCRDVKVSWLKPGPWGKDFNDYYRSRQPDPQKMHAWMQKVGVLDAGGGWA